MNETAQDREIHLLTQGCIHGMCSYSSHLIRLSHLAPLLPTEGAVLFFQCLVSELNCSNLFKIISFATLCQLWKYTIHNQNWQEMAAMQRKMWHTQCFERGMEGQKRQWGRAGKRRYDSLKTHQKKGGKPWKQWCQARSMKLKTAKRAIHSF